MPFDFWKARRFNLMTGLKEQPTTPCTFCQTPTPMLSTRHCDRCHELWTRIERDLLLAKTMIAAAEMKFKVANLKPHGKPQ